MEVGRGNDQPVELDSCRSDAGVLPGLGEDVDQFLQETGQRAMMILQKSGRAMEGCQFLDAFAQIVLRLIRGRTKGVARNASNTVRSAVR